MVIGQSHMESGRCRGVKRKGWKRRGHRHTIKRCPLLRFEDKLEVLCPTRMNNEHTSQYSPLAWLQISPVGRTWGKFSTSAERNSFYCQETVNKLDTMRLTSPVYYFCPLGCDQSQNKSRTILRSCLELKDS